MKVYFYKDRIVHRCCDWGYHWSYKRNGSCNIRDCNVRIPTLLLISTGYEYNCRTNLLQVKENICRWDINEFMRNRIDISTVVEELRDL